MIKHKWITVLMGGLILTCLIGCAPGAISADSSAVPPAQMETMEPSVAIEDELMSGTQISLPSDAESVESIDLAKQDLAQRLGISIDLITVDVVIGQEFSAGAFHCQTSKERVAKQEPARAISGLIILLSAAGHRYEYHASGQTIVFCRPLR
jgi:hypothetical protein